MSVSRQGIHWSLTVPLIAGVVGGSVLSRSGYGWLGASIGLGILVGIVSALAAPEDEFRFSLLGALCAVLACVCAILIRQWRDPNASPLSLGDGLMGIWMLGIVLAGSCLAGGLLVYRIRMR